MNVDECIWLTSVVDELASKHGVLPDEVEEVFLNEPKFFRGERGQRPGEDVYVAYGQTNAARYLVVFFIFKGQGSAFVISAREMTPRERKRYARK
jgi:hypothetical protein